MKKTVFLFIAALLLTITLSVNGVFGADFGPLVGRWQRTDGGYKKIMIQLELRDRGYPGSTYTLIYAADNDVLRGFYYHAPSRQNLSVFFVRMK